MGERIQLARAGKSQRTFTKVPSVAIDGCETSFEAADEKQAKANEKRFDDTGLMALVCRHDVPLFFANIDSPGEQQKYAVILIEVLFKHLPDTATVLVLYDIGCVLERSLTIVSSIYLSIYQICIDDQYLNALSMISCRGI